MCTHLSLPLGPLEQKGLTNAQWLEIQEFIQQTQPHNLLNANPMLSAEGSLYVLSPPLEVPSPCPRGSFPLSLRCLLTRLPIRDSANSLRLSISHSSSPLCRHKAGEHLPALESAVASQMCAEASKSRYLTPRTLLPTHDSPKLHGQSCPTWLAKRRDVERSSQLTLGQACCMSGK